MHALVFLCIIQHTKFQVPNVTDSADMIGANFLKKVSRDPDHAHYKVVCHLQASTSQYRNQQEV